MSQLSADMFATLDDEVVVAEEVAGFSESAVYAVPTGILLDSYVGSNDETVAANAGSPSRRLALDFLFLQSFLLMDVISFRFSGNSGNCRRFVVL